MVYPEIAIELIKLAENDLAVREQLLNQGKLSEGYNPQMREVHQKNSLILRDIIKQIGYPTISKVGEKASGAAWLIIQHAISEPDFMINSYNLMLEHQQDISPENIAYLYDRIQVYQSKPQKYGTQMISSDTLYPVENSTHINKYRNEVGLPLLTDFQLQNIPSSDQIKQIDNQDAAYNQWRKEIGWIK